MKFNNYDDEEGDRDYFDGPDIEEHKEPQQPRHKPDEPEYYDEDESQWEHLKPRRGRRFLVYLIACAVCVGIIVAVWMRYFTAYSTEGTMYGYVESLETRGVFFQTSEGVLIPYKELMDTTRAYNRDFIFTAGNKKVAELLKLYQMEARPVRVTYSTYYTAVPWRGESRIIINAVDSADPSRILPPEFTPDYYRMRKDRTDTLDKRAINERMEDFEY